MQEINKQKVETDLNKENAEPVEDLTTKVLQVINALKYPDISQQIDKNRESVFKRVVKRIDNENHDIVAKNTSKKRLLRLLSIASLILLIIVPAAIAYYIGYGSGSGNRVSTKVETVVPYGITSRIILSDGTLVTLNGGSTLSYPSSFTGERHVLLTGEGYFDVAKDEKNPFIVHSANLTITVLGTRFGFKTYEDDQHAILTLEEGSVKAVSSGGGEEIILKPNQQLAIDKETGEIQCRNVEAEQYTLWKDNILNFKDLTLGEIAVILERRFNTRIEIVSDSIGKEQYVATFKYGENVEQILDKLSYKRSWKYIKEDGIIKIVSKKTNSMPMKI